LRAAVARSGVFSAGISLIFTEKSAMHRFVPTYAHRQRNVSSAHLQRVRKCSPEEILMRNPIRPLIVVLLVAGTLLQTASAAADPVPYPVGYRDWMHVKSMVIQAGHPLYESFGGIHHLYANDKAQQGYRSGRFPDGAVIVFDLLTAVGADNAITEGPRKVVGVMHKDSRRYASTGGWGFEGFAGDSTSERVVSDQAATACFACHEARKASDYVFSESRP
jgi:uncharacterized ParB-like nuclease family protein